MKEKKYSLDEAFKIAVDLHTKNKINDAEKVYKQIIKAKPDFFLAYSNLGIIYSQKKDFKKAIEFFNKTIEINSNYPEALNNLGNVYFELSDLEKSLTYYNKAVNLNKNFSDAFNNLGNVYAKKKNIKLAIENYNKSISLDFKSPKDKPFFNLGNLYREENNLDKSIEYYNKAININPDSVDSFINLSISLNRNGKFKEAIKNCEKAVLINPSNIQALNNLGEFNQEIGNTDLAINYYKKTLAIDPNNLRAKWLLMNTFPIIYKNFDQIDSYKKHFEKNIDDFEKFISEKKDLREEKILNALSSSTNFYLHYNGTNVTNLQKKYSSLVSKLTKKIYPNFTKKIELSKGSKNIKVGFISSHIYEHVIMKLFKNWIIKINKDNFKTFVYHTGSKVDKITSLVKEASHNFYNNMDTNNLVNKIYSDKLDILIYLDIGMDPKIQILASLRLAPIQCCAYGVPVTSGFNSIDYFLTSEKMETIDSDLFYAEKLIRLPNLGVNYDILSEEFDNYNINKDKNRFYFLTLQSNFKLLPQHDHIYFDIIKKNPQCKFWFLGKKNQFIVEKFKDRLSSLSEKKNIIFDDYFQFFYEMPYKKYLSLIKSSDAIIDSFDWSGLNTSLEAIYLDKPIITMPSKWMRGRHTYAVLKILELDELICNSKNDYIDVAVKLSTNLSLFEKLVEKIKLNKKNLFNNNDTIHYLENFFISIYNK